MLFLSKEKFCLSSSNSEQNYDSFNDTVSAGGHHELKKLASEIETTANAVTSE